MEYPLQIVQPLVEVNKVSNNLAQQLKVYLYI